MKQIELLQYLNTHQTPQPEKDLTLFFQKWQERINNKESKSKSKFEFFLKFLLQNRLVSQNIVGCSISLLGKEYLCFTVRVGRPTL